MALIVELFGPPGSGKTTFAKALAAQLRAANAETTLHLSARPGEGEGGGASFAKLNRIAQPLWNTMTTRGPELSSRTADATARLAPRISELGYLRQFRIRQYLRRLASLWSVAERRSGIVIFDQAFLQLAASLLALQECAEGAHVLELVRVIPFADVAVRIDADPAKLEQRLASRLRDSGAVGRLLEAGAGRSEVYGALSALLQDACETVGMTTIRARSTEDRSFDLEVEKVAACILQHASSRRPAAFAS